MPSAYDYGDRSSNESTLVPGTLTVFRHFMMDAEDGYLYPMNSGHGRGGITARMVGWPVGPGSLAYPPATRAWMVGMQEPTNIHEARCSKMKYTAVGNVWDDPHEAPQVDCSCGFYAHYDPNTDFYEGACWGYNSALATGRHSEKHLVIVRAVCEVQGRVIMGRLGVRAQKMRIIALTPDWYKKQRVGPDYNPYHVIDWRVDLDDPVAFAPKPAFITDEDERTEAAARVIAANYDAKYYDSAAVMYDAHPKADIEALGIDTSPRKIEDFMTTTATVSHANGYQIQANAYVQALNDSIAEAKKAIADLGKALGCKDVPVTAFEKAMTAKKNRPAPPGSGIDRRKRKL